MFFAELDEARAAVAQASDLFGVRETCEARVGDGVKFREFHPARSFVSGYSSASLFACERENLLSSAYLNQLQARRITLWHSSERMN
jgi:hypothetical protein